MTEDSQPIEIGVGSGLRVMAFTKNGGYVISGDGNELRVWQVEDGKQMTTMSTGGVYCLAVSKEGKWIAAGTYWNGVRDGKEVSLWDAKTYEHVFAFKEDYTILAVDFSPDSTRVISGSKGNRAIIWDIPTRKRIKILRHEDWVVAAKYSPEGDRIATATESLIQVWDSNGSCLLVQIKVRVLTQYNTGLLWFNDHLFVVSNDRGGRIKELDTSTGSVVAEWPVNGVRGSSCIALPKQREFIACSTESTVTFWDMSTHTQLGLIQYPQDIRSIAISPCDRFLVIGGYNGKISTKSLSRIIEPDMKIGDAVLDLWKHNRPEDAEALLTTAITMSQNPAHHLLANRALVRTRLRLWDEALFDAETAINIRPSVIGFVAKSVAHVGKGEKEKGYQACDIAFERFRSSHVSFLLLIKAVITFMAGEHIDAISRVDDLIATVTFNSIYYMVQSYMHLLLGNSQMERGDYDHAIQSFERARAQMRNYVGPPLVAISLISGWNFDHLGIMIQQRLCEALNIVGRTEDAVECFQGMASGLGVETNVRVSEHS